MVGTVCETMGGFYKELYEKRGEVEALILEEEKLFLKTLEQGMSKLDDILETVTDGVISGYDAFKLYDTYGFPLELTEEIATEKGYRVDSEGFVDYMNKQKEAAKKSNRNKTSMAKQKQVLMDFKKPSTFVYGLYRLKSSVLAIISKDTLEKTLDHDGYIVLKRTCFYAESGGQVADTGMITGKNFTARVVDVFKGPNGQHIHKVKLLSGKITTGDECEVIIDKERRHNIEANHSSVHMLQYALQTVISPKIMQAGSYVDDSKLRFDFTYTGKIFDEDLYKVEDMVNDMINRGIITSTEVMPLDKAKELGAMALFGEKYGETVRVVKIDKSIELCGGTHIANTKDVNRFAISSFESKGSNTYRIEACTNKKIETTLFDIIKPYNDEMVKLLMKSKEILEQARGLGINLTFDVTIDNSAPKSYRDIVFNRNELSYVQGEVKTLERKFQEEKEKQSLGKVDEYLTNLKDINGKKFLYLTFEHEEMEILKAIMDAVANKLDNSLVFIVNIKEDNSVNFLCRNKVASLSAGYLIKQIAAISNGNGGGSTSFAQGGGKTSANLEEIYKYLVEQINEAE